MVLLYKTDQAGGFVWLLWVPVHIGVEWNEADERAAKMGLKRDIDVRVVFENYEYKSITKRNITAVCQKVI